MGTTPERLRVRSVVGLAYDELRAMIDHAVESVKPKPPVSVEQCAAIRDQLVKKVVGASVEVYHHHHTLIVRVFAGIEVVANVPLA